MGLVIRHVALEGYKYIRRSGNIVCVFMCKVDIRSWPGYYFNGSYYIDIYLLFPSVKIDCSSRSSIIFDIQHKN